jgi:hypothetical protein
MRGGAAFFVYLSRQAKPEYISRKGEKEAREVLKSWLLTSRIALLCEIGVFAGKIFCRFEKL